MRQLRVLSGVAVICAAFTAGQPVQAGFGLFGHGSQGGYGSSGGASYGGYGSSGGSSGGASYGGSSGGYGSSGSYAVASPGYGSSGGHGSSGGTVGPIRRLAAKIHAHHAAKVAARHSSGGASYGSSGSVAVYSAAYGSSGGSSGGSYSYSGGSSGSSVGYTGGSSGSVSYSAAYSNSAGAGYDSYAAAAARNTVAGSGYDTGAVVEPEATEASIDGDAALLTVSVPENAKVTVNGLSTSSKGAIRQFMSNGLKEGFVYTYVVDVTFADAGQSESKTVKLRAGSTERLVFNEPQLVEAVVAPAAPETVVTLHVPASAKVNLAGNDTKGDGVVRTFRTRQLADGEQWANYTIRVSTMIGGVPVTKERTLDLKAGDSHDFVFDFDTASVASR